MARVVQWEYHRCCIYCQPAHHFSRVLYSGERPSVRCIQWIPLLRVEIHEHVIKNKGNGGGISQYITVKLLNYLPKGDLDWNIAARTFWKVSAGSQPLISAGCVVMYSKLLSTKDADLPGRAKRDGVFFHLYRTLQIWLHTGLQGFAHCVRCLSLQEKILKSRKYLFNKRL